MLYVSPYDCLPPHGLDMTGGSDPERVETLYLDFVAAGGFSPGHPALIGYPYNGKIQLLSGTHRLEAAKRANVDIPLVLWLRSDVEAAWGDLDKWRIIMEDVPIRKVTK